jgi:hypothetical protein
MRQVRHPLGAWRHLLQPSGASVVATAPAGALGGAGASFSCSELTSGGSSMMSPSAATAAVGGAGPGGAASLATPLFFLFRFSNTLCLTE